MVKKLIGKLSLVIAVVLMFAIAGLAFIAGGALHPVKAADINQWDYAELIYTAKTSKVVWAEIDDDARKTSQDAYDTFKKNINLDSVPYIYYLNIAGRFGWELILEQDDASGSLFTFKKVHVD